MSTETNWWELTAPGRRPATAGEPPGLAGGCKACLSESLVVHTYGFFPKYRWPLHTDKQLEAWFTFFNNMAQFTLHKRLRR